MIDSHPNNIHSLQLRLRSEQWAAVSAVLENSEGESNIPMPGTDIVFPELYQLDLC